MSNIVRFPKEPQKPPDAVIAPVAVRPRAGLLLRAVRGAWTVLEFLLFTILILPVTRWIVTAVATFHFFRMLIYLNQPEVNAGWMFLMWFGVLVLLKALPVIWTPKAMRGGAGQ